MRSAIVHRLRKSAAPFALSNLALGLIVATAFRFNLNTAIVVLLCLLVTVLHALADGCISSGIVSVIAGACLVYFFIPPIFTFRIEDPLEVVGFLVFLIVANGVAWLVSKVYEALRDSKRELALVESAGHLGLWNYDLRTKAMVTSREYLRLYGLPEDGSPLTWQQWLGLVHSDDREDLERLLQQSLENKQAWETEFRVVPPDGSVRWLLGKGSVLLSSSGAPVRMAGVSVDITERKKVQSALRESEERFTIMADTAPVMIWASGPDKLCTYFNKVWLGFTGRTIEQELGNGWADGVHPADLGRCWDIYASSFDARRSFQMEYRLKRADGEYGWVLDSGIPRFEPDGRFAGYVGSCIEITDLKRTQEGLLARQRLATVGSLASGIVHDFGNLLGGILANSELALEELASGSIPAEELEKIGKAAIRGADIARQLMIYAEQESEVLEFVDTSEIVEDMLELLRVSVSKHVSVETRLDGHVRAVRANPSQIRQVVMNLIMNASEAIGDREGVIRVTTRQVKVGSHSHPTASERMTAGDYVQLEVSDTGRGMTMEVQSRAFDMFFTTKVAGSHGLGLAVVQGIVERLHGTIQVSSAPGKGTRFQVALPCKEQIVEGTNGAIACAGDEKLTSWGATILVVEDEDLMRQGVSKTLRNKGMSVLEASDGFAALEMIRTHKDDIDVLLLDITLPGASSSEVHDEARRLRPDLPVIVTSAFSKQIAATSLERTVEFFLRKPFRLSELVEMIREILSSGRAQDPPVAAERPTSSPKVPSAFTGI